MRQSMLRHAALLASIALFAPGTSAAGSGDPANGQTLARKLCSNCHIVDDQTGKAHANASIASFKSIAGKPGMTPERLAGAIIIPHPEMPNVPLTRREIQDLIAYIMSLQTKN